MGLQWKGSNKVTSLKFSTYDDMTTFVIRELYVLKATSIYNEILIQPRQKQSYHTM